MRLMYPRWLYLSNFQKLVKIVSSLAGENAAVTNGSYFPKRREFFKNPKTFKEITLFGLF